MHLKDQVFYGGVILITMAAISATFAVFGRKGARLESDIYNFTPKFQSATKNNILSGITFFAWVSILWRRLYDIDFATYWRRIVFITFMSILNSIIGCLEHIWYGSAIQRQRLHEEPVFILGHPRTGTTHLFNILSLDRKFSYTNTFQAGFPSGFLLLERYKSYLNDVVDSKRPMDNMALTLDSPQEDELGVNVLSHGTSYYQPIVFMKNEKEYRKYINFENGAKSSEKRAWLESFLYLMKKVTLKHTRVWDGAEEPSPLLIKSPVHTGRVKLLLQLFPKAKFIYIHRNPYDVFLSAARMADTAYWYSYLNTPTNKEVIEFIVWQYQCLYRNYIRDRDLISRENLYELSFSALNANPMSEIANIYEHFGWKDFVKSGMKDSVARYLGTLQGYKKSTRSRSLTSVQKSMIQSVWGDSFDTFDYKL